MRKNVLGACCISTLSLFLTVGIDDCSAQAETAQTFISFSYGQVLDGVKFSVDITDQLPSDVSGPAGVDVVKEGNVYKVCVANPLTGEGEAVSYTRQIPFPAIPAGEYEIDYSEANYISGQARPPCKQKLTRAFTVIPVSDAGALVEYYNAELDHYFQTADPYERYVLNNNIIPGWVATGVQTSAFSATSPASADLSPVCRFYGRPEAGINSHFFSAIQSDCEIVLQRWPESWQLESMNAFEVTPLLPNGRCPVNLFPMIRLYNNKPDANHRYTISANGAANMEAKGWIIEGPVWCAAGPR